MWVTATLLRRLDRRRFPRLRHGWADGGTAAPFWTGPGGPEARVPGGAAPRRRAEAALATARRHTAHRVPLRRGPRRWVVERTFAWLGRVRRLSKDYEFLTATSEAVIYLAMTRLLLRRLTRP